MKSEIESLLDICDKKIQHLSSPELRADALLKLIKVEYSNAKKPNLIDATRKGLVEMFNSINKAESIQEIEFAIQILSDNQKSKSIPKAIPLNRYSEDLAERFTTIMDTIDIIIHKN